MSVISIKFTTELVPYGKVRYKSSLTEYIKYFLTVSRYIEVNPVRADMVGHPAEYSWSGYHKNALGKPIELITPHTL